MNTCAQSINRRVRKRRAERKANIYTMSHNVYFATCIFISFKHTYASLRGSYLCMDLESMQYYYSALLYVLIRRISPVVLLAYSVILRDVGMDQCLLFCYYAIVIQFQQSFPQLSCENICNFGYLTSLYVNPLFAPLPIQIFDNPLLLYIYIFF